MEKVYVLYNPIAGNSTCEEKSRKIAEIFPDKEISYVDLTSLDNPEEYINTLPENSKVILCGGDGTLNYFANYTNVSKLQRELFYYPAGSGNDFYNDIDEDRLDGVYDIKKYLVNLPTVEVNGMKKCFLNGIGYGIDGYCCEEGDIIRAKAPGKRVNYTKIALKGLLYGFSRANAKVTVDGITKEYTDVWMVPTMNGRFYGGGMMCAPNQERLNSEHSVSVIIVTSPSRIKLIFAFLSIFKGEHLKYTKIVEERIGKEVHVEFDRPTALQIDGETVRNVTEYYVHTV